MKKVLTVETSGLFPKRSMERKKDLKLLYELMPNLSDSAVLAIYLRFWERLLIEEIAEILNLSWNEVNHLIEHSIKELRTGFLNNELNNQLENQAPDVAS